MVETGPYQPYSMKKANSIPIWLLINLTLIISSLMMEWFFLGFEPETLFPIYGWDFIFTRVATSIGLLSEYGFGWLWILSLFQGVGGVTIMIYGFFRAPFILKRKNPPGSKAISIFLLSVVVVFLLSDLGHSSPRWPLPGYWLFILGVLSSAAFEWQKVVVNTVPEL